MSSTRLSARGFARSLGLCAAAFFCAAISLLAMPCSAQQQDDQSVAEAARQEKARKAAQQKNESHVYTNEDLKQTQILIEPDRARVEARKHDPAATPEQPITPAVDAQKNSAPESLGEVARRYRREKSENAKAAEPAARPAPPSHYPMDLSQPSLAAPVKPVAPPAPSISRPRQPVQPLTRVAPSKRDPFSRQFVSPPLSNSAPALSPIRPVPARPVPPLANVAPHAPAVRIPSPGVAPKLLLPSKPLSSPTSLAPRHSPVVPPVSGVPSNNIRAGHTHSTTIRVQPGDSLWKLARLHLGSGTRWSDLLDSNPNISDPARIQPGTLLVVPAPNHRPRSQPPTSRTGQPGDSLWKLAASHHGSGTAWTCIAQANPQLPNPIRLRPGQTLSLPASCATPPQP